MASTSTIEWTDATWPSETPMTIRESNGRVRQRVYTRKRTDRPGTAERRARAAAGERWCRGCQTWLPSRNVNRAGVCKPCAAAEYRANYAGRGGDAIRAQKTARKRGLAIVPAWWRRDSLTGTTCAYGCGRPATTLDHIWPVALGGESRPGNLAPCCGSCNSSKKHSDPAPWIARGIAAHPDFWLDQLALAAQTNCDEWAVA